MFTGAGKRRAKRVNSEPHIESISALRAKDRMVTSLSEGVQREYGQNSSKMTKDVREKESGGEKDVETERQRDRQKERERERDVNIHQNMLLIFHY